MEFYKESLINLQARLFIKNIFGSVNSLQTSGRQVLIVHWVILLYNPELIS